MRIADVLDDIPTRLVNGNLVNYWKEPCEFCIAGFMLHEAGVPIRELWDNREDDDWAVVMLLQHYPELSAEDAALLIEINDARTEFLYVLPELRDQLVADLRAIAARS